MKLIPLLSLLVLGLWQPPLQGQSLKELTNITPNSIVVRQSGQLTKAHILLDDPKVKVHNNRRYFYYTQGRIHQVQGGYHGHLLHGEYCDFQADSRLQTQGWFKNGLKHGLWKEWNVAGDLIQETIWRKGKGNGSFTRFEARKQEVVRGKNKDGKLHGRVKTYYDGELTTIRRYQQGELKKTIAPTPLWQRARNLFTKDPSKVKSKKAKGPKEKKAKKTKGKKGPSTEEQGGAEGAEEKQ